MTNPPAMIPAETPEGVKLSRLYALAQQIRGSFMEQAIWVDVIITDILAQYFVPDEEKRRLFSSDILAGPDISFSGRINILERVISRSYTDFERESPQLCDRLNKIRRFRNRLAHAHLDTSDDFLTKWSGDHIQIIFYEDGTAKTQRITVEENNNRLKECSAVLLELAKLQSLVKSTATT